MAGTINYLYDLHQPIWVITFCTDGASLLIRQGTIIRIRGTIVGSPTLVTYDIQLVGDNGTTLFNEEDVFADISSASSEYQTRLTS